MAITFGGQKIKRPGAYSVVDSSGMVPVSSGSFSVLAFIGLPGATLAEDTDTSKVLYFNSPKVAAATLGEGALLEHLRVAWAHGADLIGVSFVNPSTPAPTEEVPNPQPVVTDAEWQAAVDRLDMEYIDAIVPVTTNATLQAKVHAHVTEMSSVKNRKERRAFYGHAPGLTAEGVAALTTPFNANGRGVLASPGPIETDSTGATVAKDSTYTAAAMAGTWASKAFQDPITYDYLKFVGLNKLYSPDDIELLLEAGVACVEYVKNRGFRIVQGITMAASEDLTEKELSVATLKDAMSKELRDTLEEKHVGKAATAGISTTIYNDAISIIDGFIKNGWITDYDRDSVNVEQNVTAFYVEWLGKPTLPINNFFITSHFTL